MSRRLSLVVFEDISTSFPSQFAQETSSTGWNCQIDETHLRPLKARDVFFYETSCSFDSESLSGYEPVRVYKNNWEDLEAKGATATETLFQSLLENSFEEIGQRFEQRRLGSLFQNGNIESRCIFSPIRIEKKGKKSVLNAEGVECTTGVWEPKSRRLLFGLTATYRNVKCTDCEDMTNFLILEKFEFIPN